MTEQAAQPPENRSFIPTPSGASLKPHQLALVGMIFGIGGLATILFFNILQAIGFAIVIGVLAYSYLSIKNERESMSFQPGQPLIGQGPPNAMPGSKPEAMAQGDGSMVPEFARSTSNTHDFSPFPRPNHAEFNAKALAELDAGGIVSAVQGMVAGFGTAHGAQTGAPLPAQTMPTESTPSQAFPTIPGGMAPGFPTHPGVTPAFPAHPGVVPSGVVPSGAVPAFPSVPSGEAPPVPAAYPGAAAPSVPVIPNSVQLGMPGSLPPQVVGFTPAHTVASSQANFAAVPQMSIPPDQVMTVPPTQTTCSNPFMRRSHSCWKCKDIMYVYSWPGHHMWSTDSPPQPKPESVQFRFYQTIGAKFWANVCQKCDAVQGDHLVFDEHSPYKWENFS